MVRQRSSGHSRSCYGCHVGVATIRNLTLNNSSTSKTKICQVYKGVVKGQGSTSALGVEFNTPNYQVSQGDVALMPPSQINTSACAGSCPIP